jgi:hypothetical protein
MNNINLLSAVSVLIFTHIFVFAMGFVVAFTFTNRNGSLGSDMAVQSFFDKQKQKKAEKVKQIKIDDTKVVLNKDIKTDNLEKKFDKLGTNTKSKNDIASSVNKLKNMRG